MLLLILVEENQDQESYEKYSLYSFIYVCFLTYCLMQNLFRQHNSGHVPENIDPPWKDEMSEL